MGEIWKRDRCTGARVRLASTILALLGGAGVVWYFAGPWSALTAAGLLLVAFGDVALAAWTNARADAAAGVQGLIGRRAVVVEAFRLGSAGCTGRVRIYGELWRARADAGAEDSLLPGDSVVIRGAAGSWLEVCPA